MISHILSNPAILAHCQAGEWEQAATALGALTTSTVIDGGDFTKFDTVVTRLGQEAAGLLRVGLERALAATTAAHAAAVQSAPNDAATIALEAKMLFLRDWVAGLRNPGVVYSNATVVANLDEIAAGLIAAELWTSQLVTAVKSIGVSVRPTISPAPNAASVEAAWGVHVQQQRVNRWSQVNGHVVNEILNAGGTWADALAYVAGQEE